MGSGRHGHSHESHGHSHESHGHSHESHGHSHGHSHGKEKNFLGCCFCSDTTRLSSMLVMTSFFFLVELIVGQISKSIALTADSFHMLSDALALIIGLFTTIISKRLSNKNTFGWIRAEVLGPLINSVFLIALCLGIVIEALKRLFKPEAVEDIDLLLYVGILGLLINIAGLFLFGHGHSHSIPHAEEDDEDEDNEAFDDKEVQKPLNSASVQTNPNPKKPNKKKCCTILSKEANMNMRAVFLHVLADALGSVIVIISALLNKYQSHLHISEKIIVLIDPILCLCLVALIFSTTFPLFKESALILLQTVPKEIQVTKLKQDLVDEIPGVSAVHELHIWKLSGRKIIATAHVTCHNTAEYMQLAAEIKEFFHKRGIHSTTIQPEFTQPVEGIIAYESCMIECMKDCTENTCCGQSNLANNNKSVASQLKNLANQPNEPMTIVEASAVVVTFK